MMAVKREKAMKGGGAEQSRRKALVVPASCQMMPLIASLLVQKQKV